ncbi:unnamed protein product [Paramecium sonneborni]|uniref:Protein kinase domain-containing protein n=1 Tax=Paramecium sonneborni TaxID=65129 RepID=A0A8S1NIL0_9CILI|nr:unnamed protein product [Paramecium sonneborni]
MHRNGICHRDLKPNNILSYESIYINSIDKNQIKVTDFNQFGDFKDREEIEMWTYTGTIEFSASDRF